MSPNAPMYPCNLALNLKYERYRLLYKSCEKRDGSWREGRGGVRPISKRRSSLQDASKFPKNATNFRNYTLFDFSLVM